VSNKIFNHLILLIGTNPLPNFVVAEYFLQQNPNLQKIWLVHSEEDSTIHQKGTKQFAENLKILLEKRLKPERSIAFDYVALSNVSRAKEIGSCFKEKCLDHLEPRSAVHVNYTGGTKVMCTQVYRSIEQEQEKIVTRSFSYLDAKTFRIIYDDERPDSPDLREHVALTFAEMIFLHGYKRVNEPSSADFSKAVKVFTELIANKKLDEYYAESGGYQRILFERKDRPGELVKAKSHLKLDELEKFQPNGVFLSVLNALPEGYRFLKDDKFMDTEFKNNAACEDTVKFLDGGWLEEYVYDVLATGILEAQVSKDKNWEIKKDGWQGDSKFELDVVLIKGYQLIGISCTTDGKKGLCKSKGFEIILRTQQIGGDEAKAILVTRLNEKDRDLLQQELQLDTGSSAENIIVLGKDDVHETVLLQKVQEFIKD
jgi:hypothetical protein